MYHKYSLLTLTNAIYYGWIQGILDWAPVVDPNPVDFDIPQWWLESHPWWEWENNLDPDDRPNSTWIRLWLSAAYAGLGRWIEEVGTDAYGMARVWVQAWTGYVNQNFPDFAAWIGSIWTLLGQVALATGASITGAIYNLYNWLPDDLVNGIRGWANIWGDVAAGVMQWVQANYNDAKANAIAAYNWVAASGGPLETWVNSVKQWVSDFRADPGGTISRALGAAWTWLVAFWLQPGAVIRPYLGPNWGKLVTFAENAVTFYFDLWGSYAETLSAFLDDPLGWLYDRVEDEIMRRW